jgi:hypothetical protein
LVILGQSPRAEQFAKGFREGNLTRLGSPQALLIASIALAIVGGLYLFTRLYRSRQTQRIDSDRQLFRDLCRLHHLSYGSVRLLRKLAADAKLTSVVEIFLRPELVVADANDSASRAARIAELRRRLFTAS